jgi:hypothetical protein
MEDYLKCKTPLRQSKFNISATTDESFSNLKLSLGEQTKLKLFRIEDDLEKVHRAKRWESEIPIYQVYLCRFLLESFSKFPFTSMGVLPPGSPLGPPLT